MNDIYIYICIYTYIDKNVSECKHIHNIYIHAYAYMKCVYPVCGSYSMMNVFRLHDRHVCELLCIDDI